METLSDQYKKGFNEGYWIQSFEPVLVDILDKLATTTERISGLKAGIEECAKEKDKTLLPSWMTKDMGENVTPEKDLGDKDFE